MVEDPEHIHLVVGQGSLKVEQEGADPSRSPPMRREQPGNDLFRGASGGHVHGEYSDLADASNRIQHRAIPSVPAAGFRDVSNSSMQPERLWLADGEDAF